MQPALADVVQNLILPALDRDDRRLLRRHQVVALMRAAGARLAEVVDVGRGACDREDERRHARLFGVAAAEADPARPSSEK